MKDYLSQFLTKQTENAGALKSGNRQNRQKLDGKSEDALSSQPTKPSKAPSDGFVGDRSQSPASFPLDAEENIEMHNSALFDVVVEVTYYTGERLRIRQQSTPEGWTAPF